MIVDQYFAVMDIALIAGNIFSILLIGVGLWFRKNTGLTFILIGCFMGLMNILLINLLRGSDVYQIFSTFSSRWIKPVELIINALGFWSIATKLEPD